MALFSENAKINRNVSHKIDSWAYKLVNCLFLLALHGAFQRRADGGEVPVSGDSMESRVAWAALVAEVRVFLGVHDIIL